MAFRANQQLREDIWDYRYKPSGTANENIVSFEPSPAKEYGATALNLVHQAAEIFSGMENHARERDTALQGQSGTRSRIGSYPQAASLKSFL